MNRSSETDLFEISLTPSGSSYLLRLYTLAKLIFTGVIIITLIHIVDLWLQGKMYNRSYGKLDWLSFISLNIYPIYMVLVMAITLVQIYFFLHFARLCNRAIRQQQTELFNTSFRWLYRNTVTACITLLIELIAGGFFLFGKFWLTEHMPVK